MTLHVLLVDDDATDRELFREAIHLSGRNCSVAEAANGEEALSALGNGRLPHLIILDLNMPVKDGRETLQEIKSNSHLKCIPVCVMSTSSAHFDVQSAYANGASLFLVKPHDFRQLTEMINSLLGLFQQFVTLPGGT